MSGARHWEQDKEATVYVGNLDERVSDSLVWELMLQAGRIVNVHLPKDRVAQTHQGYGFVEFISEEDAEYAAKIMNQVRLYGKPIRVNKASADKQKTVEVGAELFVGNLDAMVDEKTLYDTFSRFGGLVQPPKIARDDAGLSKGYGFVSFSDFDASDSAIENMNGKYLMNKEISVQYAYKKDGKGERHGDQAERMLAAEARKHNVQLPTQAFPTHVFNAPTANASVNMVQESDISRALNGAGGSSANYMTGRVGMPNGGYPGVPPALQHQQQRPPLQGVQPLPAPPSGLPARPPPSNAGYGGPQHFNPSGYPQPAPGFPHPGPPPAMVAPPGFGPPPGQGQGPPGFSPQSAYPPGFPQGPPAGYGKGR